jgi:hypothetical protein
MGADSQGHINSAGFPLQIGLRHAINSTCREHGWHVLHSEHGWMNAQTHESGFIDLVVQNDPGTIVLNVECKRPQEATWQFLLPAPEDDPTGRAKFWASSISTAGTTSFDWLDSQMRPISFESEFCVVPGQDSKSRPMLERIAAQVVASTEALAHEEADVLKRQDWLQMRVYINVIATTAKLEACKFDPAKVDLGTGKIDEVDCEEVQFIRFRKQLAPRPKTQDRLDFRSLASAKENTVFVVQAHSFLDFLKQIRLDNRIGERVLRNS